MRKQPIKRDERDEPIGADEDEDAAYKLELKKARLEMERQDAMFWAENWDLEPDVDVTHWSRQRVAAGKTATKDASAPQFRPPFTATRRQQVQWEVEMQDWLSDKLDDQNFQYERDANAAAPTAEEMYEMMAIAEAHAGNPERLRKLYPRFADCISSPKRYRKQPKRDPAKEIAKMTADYARRIRGIWRAQYGKERRRTSKGEKSAESFAVDIIKDWYETKAVHLTVDAVLAAAKPSGKHKPGSRNTRQKAQVAR